MVIKNPVVWVLILESWKWTLENRSLDITWIQTLLPSPLLITRTAAQPAACFPLQPVLFTVLLGPLLELITSWDLRLLTAAPHRGPQPAPHLTCSRLAALLWQVLAGYSCLGEPWSFRSRCVPRVCLLCSCFWLLPLQRAFSHYSKTGILHLYSGFLMLPDHYIHHSDTGWMSTNAVGVTVVSQIKHAWHVHSCSTRRCEKASG